MRNLKPLVEEGLAIYRMRPSGDKLIWVEGMIDAAVLYRNATPAEGDAWEEELRGGPGFHPYWTWREVHRRRQGGAVWKEAPPEREDAGDPDQDVRDAVAHLEARATRTRMLLAQSLLGAAVKGSGLPEGTADRWEAELRSWPHLFDENLTWRKQRGMRPAVNVRKVD